ncbi:MAG TPA: Rne/Rng family ribonuclease [Clostridia bacterium]|nr:Rne/Rng family ribonuclease [Clostridia bacterium]
MKILKRLILDIDENLNQIALLEDGKLKEYHPEKKDGKSILGNIYKGKVQNVLKGMQSAFVDIGIGKNAFLFSDDILFRQENFNKSITQVLKPGQVIMVQISKEAVGMKNPRVTANISLPGKYVVLMPSIDYVGISHRIEKDEDRKKLLEIAKKVKPQGIGLIMRTASLEATEGQIQEDLEELFQLYEKIQKDFQNAPVPSLIYKEENFLIKYLKNFLSDEMDEIIINDKEEYESIKKYLKNLGKEHVLIKYEEGDLMGLYGVDYQVEKLLGKKIWLKSGGFLIIDQTEALTVIDVNTGKYVGKTSLEETIYRTNLEAAEEIALQLKLRDIGGIIIIDFIDMKNENFKRELLEFFKKELQKDRTKCTVLGYTQLGLVEMTRKRVRSQVSTYLKEKCPMCEGEGMVYSEEYIYKKLKNNIERILRHAAVKKLVVRGHYKVLEVAEERKLSKLYREKFDLEMNFIFDDKKKYGEFEMDFE